MVQKSKKPSRKPEQAESGLANASEPTAKRRGRPRGYEPDVALGQALDQFRKTGFAATSLDDLSAATGLNRPSLYGAFGDKRELYIKSLQRYRADAAAALSHAFSEKLPIRERLRRIYRRALDIYLSGSDGPRGCFSAMTVASDAIADHEIRAMALDGFVELDRAFARSFQRAMEAGELSAASDPAALAQLASAMLHSIALRARAGVPRSELEAMADAAVDLICAEPR
jgi:AcrR family transcriptional regulator